MDLSAYTVTSGESFHLADYATNDQGQFKDKKQARSHMAVNLTELSDLQDKLYAQNQHAILLIIQAMDAAGKDGLIKHVMSGVNPQGCQVVSFKQPSPEEMDHDYLWRHVLKLPERGRIGIFNRSYYEDVLVVRVHDLLKNSQLPQKVLGEGIWAQRFAQIRHFELYLLQNGILPVKFFLYVSKEEQKQRFLDRIEDPAKNWKFSSKDIEERNYWDQYMAAYEDAIRHTATPEAPWHILPADRKWFARMAASEIIVETLKKLDLRYPVLSLEEQAKLQEAKERLLSE